MDHSVFDLASTAKIDSFTVGQEAEPVITVENCMAGAERIRQHAIERNQFVPADTFYPGIRMRIPLIYTVALAKNLRHHIKRIFGFDSRNVKKAVSSYSIVTVPPDELTLLQKIPHFDAATKKSVAAIHYLTTAPEAGTAMYRHRETGYEYVDSARYSTYMEVVKSQFTSQDREPEGYIQGSTPEYEMIESFSAQFNRVVMYRGSSLHSGIIPPRYNFDPSPETGRLTITTFIEFAD